MSHPAPRAEYSARYFVETSVPSEKVARVIAGEPSSGTFLSLPDETDALKERSRARVERTSSAPCRQGTPSTPTRQDPIQKTKPETS